LLIFFDAAADYAPRRFLRRHVQVFNRSEGREGVHCHNDRFPPFEYFPPRVLLFFFIRYAACFTYIQLAPVRHDGAGVLLVPLPPRSPATRDCRRHVRRVKDCRRRCSEHMPTSPSKTCYAAYSRQQDTCIDEQRDEVVTTRSAERPLMPY